MMLVENLFTVDEAAAILKQDTAAVYRMLAAGTLKGSRRGKRGSWEIPASELQYWVSEKLSDSEKTLLDVVQHIWQMKQRQTELAEPKTYTDALDELFVYLSTHFDQVRRIHAASHVRGRYLAQGTVAAEVEDTTALEHIKQLIELRREGKLEDEEWREILIERDWVEVYERLTNELVLLHEDCTAPEWENVRR